MNEIKEAYPLAWPVGYERTIRRKFSAFKQTPEKAQRFLRDEIKRLGASGLVVSTNLRVRADGGIYAADMDKRISDPGVAVYFKHDGKELSLCCDTYLTVWENVYAIGKTIEAMRMIDRYGVSDFITRAFTGFMALPPAQKDVKMWWQILDFDRLPEVVNSNWFSAQDEYRRLCKIKHPDAGGSDEAFAELNKAMQEAKKHFGIK